MAQDWHELAAVRDFVAALRSIDVDSSDEIDGWSLGERIAWAVDWLTRADPTSRGVDSIFRRVAEITDWTYRDPRADGLRIEISGRKRTSVFVRHLSSRLVQEACQR